LFLVASCFTALEESGKTIWYFIFIWFYLIVPTVLNAILDFSRFLKKGVKKFIKISSNRTAGRRTNASGF